MKARRIITENLKESMASVLPLAGIVFVLCLFFIPIKSGLMLSFLIGTALLIVGIALFTIGADSAMTQIGNHVGSKLTESRKPALILFISFIIGIIITIAEPDLQVLATYVPDIDSNILILTVSIGVGFFLMLSMVRILFGVPLRMCLFFSYIIVFILASLVGKDFLSVAFDSGGVTTGPMTVPFIMAIGVGVASIRSDERAKMDSFGLIALCSIGPILAVLILGFIYKTSPAGSSSMIVTDLDTSVDVGYDYVRSLPHYMLEVVKAFFPIFVFFLLFNLISLKLKKRPFKKIIIGFLFTYVGLVCFLTGANLGFSSLGLTLGKTLAEMNLKWFTVPIAMIMGWFIIGAEPAVHVLTKQVSEISAGAISENAMALTLSIAIAAANGLAMLRVITGISIFWFVAVGYAIAILLSIFTNPTYTAIAFDAGGVASGPMTAAFMLPFAMGVTEAVGGNVMTDAFGLVAMVAMMPLITVQVMGVVVAVKGRLEKPVQEVLPASAGDAVIELWEI